MRIKEFFHRLDKKTKLTMATFAALAAALIPAAVFAGYGPNGPERPIYDFSNPAEREGPTDGPHFNSFINTDVYGDERAFLDAKKCVVAGDACYQQGQSGGYQDQVTAEVDNEYIVRMYVHNDANPSINASGLGIARNTRVKIEIPNGVANGFTMLGTISADNAIPQNVFDTVDMKNNSQAFDVEYVPGSARISNAANPGGFPLNDSIVGTAGALIGENAMDGNIPGCFEHSAFVTIRVKVVAPRLQLTKRVTTPGSTDWKESLDAKVGDTVSWLINYDVTGSATAEDITIRDVMPEGVTLVPGSITWFDSNHPSGEVLPDTALGAGGFNVGNYPVGSGGAIRFRTVVNENARKQCEAKNVAFGRAKNIPERSDDAKVVVKDCQISQPVFRCDRMNAPQFVSGRTYRFTTQATASNGATIKQYRYVFSGTGYRQEATSNQPNGLIENTFPGPGTFTAKVTVDFTVDGQTKSHTSTACEQTITIPTEEEKCPIPGKQHLPKNSPDCKEVPPVLPDTGAGDIVGIFAATSIAGTVAYRVVWLRRFSA